MARQSFLPGLCLLPAVLALFFSAVEAAAAYPPEPNDEPIAVVHLAGYDHWHANVAMLGELSGTPDLAQGLEAMLKIATANQGLAGIDKTRPWMAALIPVGPLFTAYVCLPVDDLDSLLGVVRPLAEDISTDQATHKITFAGGHAIYVAQRGDWAVVAPDPTTIGRVAADPLALLGDLPKNYDVAVRLYVARVPRMVRDFLLARLDEAVAQENIQLPGENNAAYAGRRAGATLTAGLIKNGLNELAELTLGLTLDRANRRLTAEVLLVAKEGTSAAERWDASGDQKYPAGLAPSNASVEASWSFELAKPSADALVRMTDVIRAEALKSISRSAPPGEEDLAMQFVSRALDLARKTSAKGCLEGSFAGTWRKDVAALVAAVRLPEPGRSADEIARLVELDGSRPAADAVSKAAADRDGKVRVYRVSRPLPGSVEDRRSLTKFYGEKVEIVVAVGREHLYIATGRDGFKSLMKSLAASRTATMTSPRPFACSVATGEVVRATFEASNREERKKLAPLVEALGQSPGKDRVLLTVSPIERGLRVALELDEGVLRLIGPTMGMLTAEP